MSISAAEAKYGGWLAMAEGLLGRALPVALFAAWTWGAVWIGERGAIGAGQGADANATECAALLERVVPAAERAGALLAGSRVEQEWILALHPDARHEYVAEIDDR